MSLNTPERPVIKLNPPAARFAPKNWEEASLIAHVRGWCHDSTTCQLCRVELAAYQASREQSRAYQDGRSDGWVAALESVATGITSEFLPPSGGTAGRSPGA